MGNAGILGYISDVALTDSSYVCSYLTCCVRTQAHISYCLVWLHTPNFGWSIQRAHEWRFICQKLACYGADGLQDSLFAT